MPAFIHEPCRLKFKPKFTEKAFLIVSSVRCVTKVKLMLIGQIFDLKIASFTGMKPGVKFYMAADLAILDLAISGLT